VFTIQVGEERMLVSASVTTALTTTLGGGKESYIYDGLGTTISEVYTI